MSERLRGFGATIWRWAYVIWVCRVPVVGAVVGGVLLIGTAQARDLFADLGLAAWQWLAFILMVFAWAWIVHAVARRSLQYDDWIPEAHTPGGLSSARRNDLRKLFYWPALVVPRFFGMLIFVVVMLSMWRTRSNLVAAQHGLPEASEAIQQINYLLVATAAAAAAYSYLIWKRRTLGDWLARKKLRRAPTDPPLLAGEIPMLAAMARPRLFLAGLFSSRLDIALTVARVAILVALVLTIIQPHFVATWTPRLYFVPLLLGGAVLLLGEVAALSFRLRTPLLVAVVVISIGCVYATSHFHDVRWVTEKSP
jgi:hypothetical protein